ncbi:MAG: agmatine deiminase family protein, partial [Muribaculaceae bacterium]|nr:agmatine deiminase family protein [Muribaculaceae bacterium]
MNNDNSIRMLAEWEPQEAIVMALPHEDTDWAYMLDEVHSCYKEMARAIVESGEKLILLVKDKVQATELLKDLPMDNILMISMPTNDTWTRDYGVISIDTPDGLKAIDFGFNGWGLKFASCHDNLANLRLRDMGLIPSDAYRNLRGYTCEGGSLETDGQGTLLTTTECLCSPNRNGGLDKEEVEQVLSRELGFTRYLWLDHGYLAGDDTDS